MGDERIHQSARFMATCRMHDEAGRLVDDDEMLVFEDNIEWNVFSLRFSGSSRGNINFDDLSGFYFGAGAC